MKGGLKGMIKFEILDNEIFMKLINRELRFTLSKRFYIPKGLTIALEVDVMSKQVCTFLFGMKMMHQCPTLK